MHHVGNGVGSGGPNGPARAPEPISSRAASRPRILIVEDDYLVALELEHFLLEVGFDVIGIAATADAAVNKATSDKPDLVIMDIRLAGVRDGVDAAIEIYRTHGIPSIFATANTDPYTRQRAALANPAG